MRSPITPTGAISETPVELLECVRQSVCVTIGAITGTEPVCESASEAPAPFDGVVGMISFVGDFPWSFMLGLPKETAIILSEKFAGFEIEFESGDMADVVGELANVVAGDVVARLDNAGIRAGMSVPTVARGHDVEVLAPENQLSHPMQFTSEEGPFWVKVVTSSRWDIVLDRTGCCPVCRK